MCSQNSSPKKDLEKLSYKNFLFLLILRVKRPFRKATAVIKWLLNTPNASQELIIKKKLQLYCFQCHLFSIVIMMRGKSLLTLVFLLSSNSNISLNSIFMVILFFLYSRDRQRKWKWQSACLCVQIWVLCFHPFITNRPRAASQQKNQFTASSH